MAHLTPAQRQAREAGGGSWPTAHQTHLLGAALLSPPAAQIAWQQWRAQAGPTPEMLDSGTKRLLPLVHYNLAKYVDDPLLDDYRATRREILIKNQSHLHSCARLLQLFHAAGVPTLVLKGGALVEAYYPEASLRPMDDFDVLVPHDQAVDALRVLSRGGWRHAGGDPTTLDPNLLMVRHGHSFAGPGQAAGRADGRTNVDLHWHVSPLGMDTGLDDRFWDSARALSIHGVASLALCPTDQLLHVCIHGVAWAPIPPIRWVADAAMIMRVAGAEIDWPRLLELARTFQLNLPLRDTLTYLQENILEHSGFPPIPGSVLEALHQMPATAIQRRLYAAHTTRSTRWGQLPLLWARYRYYLARYNALEPDQRPPRRLNFPRYIAVHNGFPGEFSYLLRWALGRTVERTTRMVLDR